jgi:hypothetical protein
LKSSSSFSLYKDAQSFEALELGSPMFTSKHLNKVVAFDWPLASLHVQLFAWRIMGKSPGSGKPYPCPSLATSLDASFATVMFPLESGFTGACHTRVIFESARLLGCDTSLRETPQLYFPQHFGQPWHSVYLSISTNFFVYALII